MITVLKPGQGTFPYCRDIITPAGQALQIDATGQYTNQPVAPSTVVTISDEARSLLALELG
jgi:hypothetical protein